MLWCTDCRGILYLICHTVSRYSRKCNFIRASFQETRKFATAVGASLVHRYSRISDSHVESMEGNDEVNYAIGVARGGGTSGAATPEKKNSLLNKF